MAASAPFVIEQEDMVTLEHAWMGRARTVYGIVRPRRLRWLRPGLPRMIFSRQNLKRERRPFKIRWGWALLLAVALVLVIGEWGPAVSAFAALP
jgi:hypothetical protein